MERPDIARLRKIDREAVKGPWMWEVVHGHACVVSMTKLRPIVMDTHRKGMQRANPRVSIKGLIANYAKRGTMDELLKHLREVATRYYAGDVAVVDEFLQLYCLDDERPKGGA